MILVTYSEESPVSGRRRIHSLPVKCAWGLKGSKGFGDFPKSRFAPPNQANFYSVQQPASEQVNKASRKQEPRSEVPQTSRRSMAVPGRLIPEVPAAQSAALTLPLGQYILPLSRSRNSGGGNAKGSFRTWCRRLSPDDVCISSVAGLLVCPSGIRGCLPGAIRTSCSSKRGRVVCVCQVSNCKHHFFSDTGGWVDEFVPLRKPRQSTARHPTT